MDNTDKLIQDQWNSLPADVQEAISRVPWKVRVRDIAKREGLNVAQSDSLETETMLVLYGFVKPDTFAGNIMTETGVDSEQADRIEKLVTDKIFSDVEKQFEMIDALMPTNAPAANVPKPTAPEPMMPAASVPAPASSMLPETLPGEVAHDVPHVEQAAAPVPTPAPATPTPEAPKSIVEEKLSGITSAKDEAKKPASYPGGVDPYREPIE